MSEVLWVAKKKCYTDGKGRSHSGLHEGRQYKDLLKKILQSWILLQPSTPEICLQRSSLTHFHYFKIQKTLVWKTINKLNMKTSNLVNPLMNLCALKEFTQ